jgi:hypothetical protein
VRAWPRNRQLIALEADPTEVDGWCLSLLDYLYVWKRAGQRWPRITWRWQSDPLQP